MALAQYLGTLDPCHTQAEVAPNWPLYIRVHSDRIVMIPLGANPGSVSDRLLSQLVAKPLLHVRVKEDCNQCVQKLALVVDAYLNAPTPPPGLRIVWVPNEWGVVQ
jgi:hypothetical protein